MTPLQQKIQNAATEYLLDENNGGWGIAIDELSELLGEEKSSIKGCIGSLCAAKLGFTENDGRYTDCYYPNI